VYHSVFDNFAWFEKFADPQFLYEQQQARVLGLQVLRMASAVVLPYDFEEYGDEISAHLKTAKAKADSRFGANALNFTAAEAAMARFIAAAAAMGRMQRESLSGSSNAGTVAAVSSIGEARINRAMRQAERALLLPNGLPGRPWYRHAIYAPGEYDGYKPVVLPGVNEAIDKGDLARAREQLAELAVVLVRAAEALSLK
jgi:N-acetylated-alpha-linked acidic dipeptidase